MCPLFHDWLTQPGPLGGQVSKLCPFFQAWYLQGQPGLGVTGQGICDTSSVVSLPRVMQSLGCQDVEAVLLLAPLASPGLGCQCTLFLD